MRKALKEKFGIHMGTTEVTWLVLSFTSMRGDFGTMLRAAKFRPVLLCCAYDFCSTGK